MSDNRMKCKYCAYTLPRFSGHKKYNGMRLFKHVIDNHEEEFLHHAGFHDMEEYFEWLEDNNIY
jgi:hypothetical protein